MEFITIGGGEYFVDIFNGLAMFTRSGDFMAIVKIASVLAFSMAMLNAALTGSLYDAGKWFVTVFVIIQVLLFPKASLHITDKTNPALMGAQVDNVPYVVAYTASTTSQIGYAITKGFESVYSLPDDLQYTENGMIFGVNLWQAMSQAKISNAKLADSIDSFAQNCIFFDLQLNIYSFDDLKNSDDIWNFVKSQQAENRFFSYTNQSGGTSYPTCKAGASSLEGDWKQELGSPNNLAFFSKKPDLSKIVLSSAGADVSEYFLKVSKSSEQILQQAMMINALHDATENYEASQQVQLYQNARAQLQTKSTYQTLGAQAGIWIPILKIVIESVFYGAFPIVVLACLIPNLTGSVLRGYFSTFIWLASWGPIYAILHRISMGHAKTYTLSFSHDLGFTLSTQVGLSQTMADIAAMAGYMSMFVPMLAFGIAKGGAAAMSSMTTSFMSGIQGAASAAAHEGTTGNLNFGNVGVGSRNISSGVSMMNDAGQITHHNNDGSSSIDNSRAESKLGFELHGSQRIENSLSTAISQEQSLAHSQSIQSQQSTAHGFEKAINNHRSIENSQGFEQNLNSQEKSAFSNINNATTDFAKEHNISREKSAEIFGQIGANLSGSVGGAVGDKIPAKGNAGIGLDAAARWTGRSSDSDLYKEAQNYSQQQHLSKDFETVKSALQSNRFNISDSHGESINENFNKASSLSQEAGIHRENAQRLSDQQQHIKSHSFEVDQNYNNEFVRHLRDKYGSDSAALEITNPNNLDKNIRNKEIAEFSALKEQEIIGNITKPNFESQYQKEASDFKGHQSSMHNPYKFSTDTHSINNSDLRYSTNDKFDKTQQLIGSQTVDSSVINKVKKEQDEGL